MKEASREIKTIIGVREGHTICAFRWWSIGDYAFALVIAVAGSVAVSSVPGG